jgi:hypothetical protein
MDRQNVGIHFHRRRSVIVRLNEAGETLSVPRLGNDPVPMAAVAGADPAPEVVLEPTYGPRASTNRALPAGRRPSTRPASFTSPHAGTAPSTVARPRRRLPAA